MSKPFRLAVAQTVSLLGNIEANLGVAEALCREAQQHGADLILFPETHVSGYSYRNLRQLVEATAEELTGPGVQHLKAMAMKHQVVVCCGMFEREADRFFNTQVVAFPDGRIDRQRKGMTACAESGVIALDPVRRVFEWAGTRFGILICADNALADASEQFAALDVALVLHPCAGRILHTGAAAQSATATEADGAFEIGLQTSRRLGVTYATANQIGFNGEDYYPGNSWIIHPNGAHLRMRTTALPAEMKSSIVTDVIDSPRLVAL